MDERRKRRKKYAFSNENALVWTGPKYILLGIQPRYFGDYKRRKIIAEGLSIKEHDTSQA